MALENFIEMVKLLLSPDGRIGRKGFWGGFVIWLLLTISLEIAIELITGSVFVQLFIILPTYFLFVVSIKRYHDLGKSGWWSLSILVPVVGMLFIIIECGFGKGGLLKNKWGGPLTGPLTS